MGTSAGGSSASSPGVNLGGDWRGTAPDGENIALTEGGGQRLPLQALADGQVYRRVGNNMVGVDIAGVSGDTIHVEINIIGKGTGASKTVTLIETNTLAEQFAGDGDEVFAHWTLPLDLDRTVDLEIHVSLQTTGAEAGKNCSLDLHITAETPGLDLNTTTGIIQVVNEAIPATNRTGYFVSFVLAAGTYLGATVSSLHLRLERVASGAPPVNAYAIHHFELDYDVA